MFTSKDLIQLNWLSVKSVEQLYLKVVTRSAIAGNCSIFQSIYSFLTVSTAANLGSASALKDPNAVTLVSKYSTLVSASVALDTASSTLEVISCKFSSSLFSSLDILFASSGKTSCSGLFNGVFWLGLFSSCYQHFCLASAILASKTFSSEIYLQNLVPQFSKQCYLLPNRGVIDSFFSSSDFSIYNIRKSFYFSFQSI